MGPQPTDEPGQFSCKSVMCPMPSCEPGGYCPECQKDREKEQKKRQEQERVKKEMGS